MIHTNKRVYGRWNVRLACELIVDNVGYPALIENISNDGLFIRVAYINETTNFNYKSQIKLIITLSSGDPLHLNCKEIWSDKNSPSSLMKVAGMQIINPPVKYKEFLKTLG